MREGCKHSGAFEARGSGVGKIPTGAGRRGGDNEADRRAHVAVTEGGGGRLGKA
jgi:hypothetical protein